MLDYDALIAAMEDFFAENGLGQELGYYLGFFDCLSVAKRLRDEEKMK